MIIGKMSLTRANFSRRRRQSIIAFANRVPIHNFMTADLFMVAACRPDNNRHGFTYGAH